MALTGSHIIGESGHTGDHNLLEAAIEGKLDAAEAGAEFVQVVKPEKYGGGVNATASENAAAIAMAFANGDHLYLDGFYTTNQPITITNQLVMISGKGPDHSGLIFDDCNGIVINNSGLTLGARASVITNISVVTTVKGHGHTGISYTGYDPLRPGICLIVDKVILRGIVATYAPDPNMGMWGTNIFLARASGAHILSTSIYGVANSDVLRSTFGVRITNQSRDVKFMHGAINYCNDAIYIEGDGTTNIFTGSEGVCILGNHFVANVNSVRVDPLNQGDYIDVSHNHISPGQVGVDVGNANYCQINNNFFFHGDLSDSSGTWTGIILSSALNVVTGNQFLSGIGASRTTVGINVKSATGTTNAPKQNTIADNRFSGFNNGVIIGAAATDTFVRDNVGTDQTGALMTRTVAVSDAGTRSVISTDTSWGLRGGPTITAGAADHTFDIGRTDGVAGGVFFNFHTGSSPTIYDARIAASGGNGSTASGNLSLVCQGLGFFGTGVAGKQTLAAAATDAATTQTLVNSIRAALIAYGLCS